MREESGQFINFQHVASLLVFEGGNVWLAIQILPSPEMYFESGTYQVDIRASSIQKGEVSAYDRSNIICIHS